MRRRSGLFVAAAVLGVGVVAFSLLPGAGDQRTEADEPSATASLASAASPSPDLIRRLDFELLPPPAAAQKSAKVAAVAPLPATPQATEVAAPATAIPQSTVTTAVNVRSGPSTASATLSVLKAGEAVQTGEISGGWVEVTLADGTRGWVYGSYISSEGRASVASAADDPPPPPVAAAGKARAVVHGDASALEDRTARIASRLAAFSKPLESAPTIFTLQPGDRVHIAQVRGDWIKVETEDGAVGWIRRAD